MGSTSTGASQLTVGSPSFRRMTPNTTFTTPQFPQFLSLTKEENVTDGDTSKMDKMENIVLCTLIISLGITGNSMVIWVAGFKLKPKVTNVWLVNLAVADLIFCMTNSLSLITKIFYDYWPIGEFLCKFNGFFKYANMFCSVFLLAVISIDRALCIWHPIVAKNHRTLCASRLVSTVVWLGAVILSAPYFAYRKVILGKNNLSKCTMESDNQGLYTIRFLCGFLLPFIIILLCYILAALGIRRTRLLGKSRPLRVLALLVCAFFLCWAPYHCILLARLVSNEDLKIGLKAAKFLAYFNSCINPLLYFCMGLNVRGSRFGRTLIGVYQRALAEDGDGRNTHSNERTVDYDTPGSQSQPPTLLGQTQGIKLSGNLI